MPASVCDVVVEGCSSERTKNWRRTPPTLRAGLRRKKQHYENPDQTRRRNCHPDQRGCRPSGSRKRPFPQQRHICHAVLPNPRQRRSVRQLELSRVSFATARLHFAIQKRIGLPFHPAQIRLRVKPPIPRGLFRQWFAHHAQSEPDLQKPNLRLLTENAAGHEVVTYGRPLHWPALESS